MRISFQILILATLCLFAYSKPKHYELEGYTFEQYVEDFQKTYVKGSDEYAKREIIFYADLEDVRAHNSEDHSWKKGVNHFTDLTQEEFEMYYFGNSKNMRMGHAAQQSAESQQEFTSRRNLETPPATWDWRDAGVVTPVKNQGHCGSCWAHATSETIESHAAIDSGKLVELSTQQITSCTSNELECGGTGGCNGAIAQLGFTYAELFHVTTEEEYPYISGNTSESEPCRYNTSTMDPVVKLMGHQTLPFNDQAVLMDVVWKTGPVAVSGYASTWRQYESGVYTGCSFKENIDVNHAIQMVGWDADSFIIRNSWGPDYGEDGYIRLQRTNTAICGMDTSPLDGAACVGDGQEWQEVCGMCGILSNSAIPLFVHNW